MPRPGGRFRFDTDSYPLEWWIHWGVWANGRVLATPLWPLVLASLVVTVVAWRRDAEHRRRALVGRCAACGYDLAGIAAGPCPECGVMVVPPVPGTLGRARGTR